MKTQFPQIDAVIRERLISDYRWELQQALKKPEGYICDEIVSFSGRSCDIQEQIIVITASIEALEAGATCDAFEY